MTAYRAPDITLQGWTANTSEAAVLAGLDLPQAFEAARRFAVCNYTLDIEGIMKAQLTLQEDSYHRFGKHTDTHYGWCFEAEDPANVFYNFATAVWVRYVDGVEVESGTSTQTINKDMGDLSGWSSPPTTFDHLDTILEQAIRLTGGTTYSGNDGDPVEGNYITADITLSGDTWTPEDYMDDLRAATWVDGVDLESFGQNARVDVIFPDYPRSISTFLRANSASWTWENSLYSTSGWSEVTASRRVNITLIGTDYEEAYITQIQAFNTGTWLSPYIKPRNVDYTVSGMTLHGGGLFSKEWNWNNAGTEFSLSYSNSGMIAFPATFADAINVLEGGSPIGFSSDFFPASAKFTNQKSGYSGPAINPDASLTTDEYAKVELIPARLTEDDLYLLGETIYSPSILLGFSQANCNLPTNQGTFQSVEVWRAGYPRTDYVPAGSFSFSCSGGINTIASDADMLSTTLHSSSPLWVGEPLWRDLDVTHTRSNPWLDPTATDFLHTAF